MEAQYSSKCGVVMLLRFTAACSREDIEAQIVSYASCLMSHWRCHVLFCKPTPSVSWEFYQPSLSFRYFFFLRWSLALSPRLECTTRSWLTATSATQVQAILLPQSLE